MSGSFDTWLFFSSIMFGNLTIMIEKLFSRQQDMGEIDTKPIESVQVALSLFEEKTDQRRSRPTSSDVSAIEIESFYSTNQIGFWIEYKSYDFEEY